MIRMANDLGTTAMQYPCYTVETTVLDVPCAGECIDEPRVGCLLVLFAHVLAIQKRLHFILMSSACAVTIGKTSETFATGFVYVKTDLNETSSTAKSSFLKCNMLR